MRFRLSFEAIGGVLAMFVCCSGAISALAADGDSETVDLKYVLPEHAAAIIVHPRQMAKSPATAAILKFFEDEDVMPPAFLHPAVIQPGNVDEVQQLNPPVPESKDNKVRTAGVGPDTVVRLSRAVDAKDFAIKYRNRCIAGPASFVKRWRAQGVKDVTVAGKQCWEFVENLQGVACAPDDRTILVSDATNLAKMLEPRKPQTSPLIERLRHADIHADAVAVFVMEPFRAAIKSDWQRDSKRIPPGMLPFLKAPDLTKALSLTLSVAGDDLVTAVVEANDEAAATELEGLAKKAVSAAKGLLVMAQLSSGGPKEPESIKAMIDDGVACGQKLLDGVRINRTSDRVVIVVKKPSDFDQAFPNLVAKAMKARAEFRRSDRQLDASGD